MKVIKRVLIVVLSLPFLPLFLLAWMGTIVGLLVASPILLLLALISWLEGYGYDDSPSSAIWVIFLMFPRMYLELAFGIDGHIL